MPRTILIPTDFSVESLILVKQAALQLPHEEIDIVLMYSAHMSDSILELMFYNPAKIIAPLLTNNFSEALAILSNKFSGKIKHFRKRVFHGTNPAAFDQFIRANQIEEAFIPKKYVLKLHANGFDPLPFIKKSNLPITEIDWQPQTNMLEKDQIAALFND